MNDNFYEISAIVLTLNEEKNIDACLSSLGWTKEIIVFDSGSTDKTLSIAQKFPQVKIINNEKWNGYGDARFQAQKHAVFSWVLMIDADERVSPELACKIQEAIYSGQKKVYHLARKTWFLGKFLKYGGWYPDYSVRLYKSDTVHFESNQVVHESAKILVSGEKVGKIREPIEHYSFENFQHYLVKSAHYARIWAEDRYKKGKRATIISAILHALARFIKGYIAKQGWRDGSQGFLLSVLAMHSTFNKYIYLWSLRHDLRVNAQDTQLKK